MQPSTSLSSVMTPGTVVQALRDAARSEYPVEIERVHGPWESSVHGFVVSVGERWVVLQRLEEAVYLDGYSVIRLKDITDVFADREGDYIERGVAELGGRPKVDFSLPVDAGAKDVLRAAAAYSNLISVWMEAEDDSPRLVGRLDRLGERKFGIWLINPRGVWTASEPFRWSYKDVTCVTFGGRYESALERFGEELPGPSQTGV